MLLSQSMTGTVHICLSNQKIERLGGPLGEMVTVSVHKTLPDATSFSDVMSIDHEACYQHVYILRYFYR